MGVVTDPIIRKISQKFRSLQKTIMEANSNEGLQDREKPGSSKTGRTSGLKYLGLAVLVIVVLALLVQLFTPYTNCSLALTDGYWSGDQWVSNGCVHKDYKKRDLEYCFGQRSKVILIGDRSDAMRYASVQQDQGDGVMANMEIRKQSDLSTPAIQNMYTELSKNVPGGSSALIIHRLQPDSYTDCKVGAPALIKAQEQFLKLVNTEPSSAPAAIAVLAPSQTLVGEELTCREYVNKLYSNLTAPLYYIDLQPPSTLTEDDEDLPIDMLLTLNLFCNTPYNGSCCVQSSASFSTYLASCLLFCVLAAYLGVWLIFITGTTFALTPHLESLSFDFDQFFALLHCVGGVTAVLFYLLVADRLDFFARADAPTSLTLFVIAIVTMSVVSLVTIKPANTKASGGADVLSHDQCNEWRGWMILMLIASHYTNTHKILMVRLMNELVVGVFLFLTGHTHFLRYWHTGELSLKRVFKGFLQMNALCLFVCLTLGTSYGSYYLVAVLSDWYLSVAVFLMLWPPTNPAQLKRYTSPRMMVLIKFVITFVLLALLRFTQDFWLGLLSWGPLSALFESFDGSTDDLFYWFFQQRYTAFSGMTFAYITVTVGTSFKSTLSQYERQLKLVGALLSLTIVIGYLYFLYSCDNVKECSSMQTYVGILPILAYIFLRNASILHHFTSGFLQEVGAHSLWLFVSHFHILNALNGKGVLVFFPGYYYLNALAVTVVYVYVFMVIRLSNSAFKQWTVSKGENKTLSESSDSHV